MVAAEVDDVDGQVEDNILYDLSVLAEWKFENEILARSPKHKKFGSVLGPLGSSARRLAWTFWKTLRLQPLEVTPCLLTESLVFLMNTTLPWHLAVSCSGMFVAVLQENVVEIRSQRDSYENALGRGNLSTDPYPQWRCLAWSPDESMVACAYSCGTVDVFDIVGTQLFTIKMSGDGGSAVPNLSNSVAALIFTDMKPLDNKWSAELLVVHRSGILNSYFVDRDNGSSDKHNFRFTNEYPLGISSAVYDARHKVLFVGGASLPENDETAGVSRQQGLTAWRVLSDVPHYKLLTETDEGKEQLSNRKPWFYRLKSSLFTWTSSNMDYLMRLCLSPSCTVLVGLHHSGQLTVWDVPSLRLRHQVPLCEQPDFDEINATFAENPAKRKKMKDLIPHKNLVDVNFWSDTAIILARCSGAVTVSSLSTLRNLLGMSPEWFEPSPRVVEAHDGGFLGLECELRFPKHRILLDDDEEFEDSDEEDASMTAMTTRVTKQIMYYLTDSERFRPHKKKLRTVTKVYRLVWLKSTTPEELYAHKIDAEEYGEALALAQAYGLDSDLVYQRQWHRSEVSLATIQDYLSKISKRTWVLHECLERVPEKLDPALELLQYGLRGTDLQALLAIGSGEDGGRFMLCDPEDGLYEEADYDCFNPEAVKLYEEKKQRLVEERFAEVDFSNLTLGQKELCRARIKLLQYLDRLKTYECILGGGSTAAERFKAEFYKDFRSQNIVQLAVEYAQASDWQALEILFTYHYGDLMPHKLAILSNFPETTSPSEYKNLLPELGNSGKIYISDGESWREKDWSEREICLSLVNLDDVDLGAFLYEASPDLIKYRDALQDVELVHHWYEMRACQIEENCRQVDNALELTKLAIERGFYGLGELLDDLVTMETLVYECGVAESLTLAVLREMPNYDRLELMMEKSPLEMYAKNVKKWLVPFLQQCDAREPGAYNHLLREFLLTHAHTDLQPPLVIFQLSKIGVTNPLIPNTTSLLQLALEVLYTTDRYDQLNIAEEILGCLPQRSSQHESSDILTLEKAIDRLERHLRAAVILHNYGVQKTLAAIRSSEDDVEEAKHMIIKLTRLAGRKSPPLKEAEWLNLYDDVMLLQDIVYRCLSPALCLQIFVESLLCSGSVDNIRLAGELMERRRHPTPGSGARQGRIKQLEYDAAVSLVLSAACEYFNSSANLTHSCMELSRLCLNLIVDSSPSIQEELDLIASLAVLDDFGVAVLPLQVRLCKDRLELVRRAVHSKASNYKQSQKLLRLAHLLRVESSDAADRDSQVFMVLAEAALHMNDATYAYQYCQQLVSAGYSQAWTVCMDLAEHKDFSDITAKIKLISFAVTFCSADMIEPILQARVLLQRQILLEKVGSILSKQTHAEGGAGGEGNDVESQSNTHSLQTALKQTQKMLSSTQQCTQAVLSSVTDTTWWKKTLNSIQHPIHDTAADKSMGDKNAAFTLQGCHPFYEGVIDKCYLDVDTLDYAAFGKPTLSKDLTPDFSSSILRLARLEELLTEGEKCDSAEEALLELAQHWLPRDTALGLAYLLSLKKAVVGEQCLNAIPFCGLALEVAQYYYSLQIYSTLRPCPHQHPSSLYLQPPPRIAQLVLHHLKMHPEKDWPPSVAPLIPLLLDCQEKLQDWYQAQALQSLASAINISRFASDPEYRKETTLGLAMSCEEKVFEMAVFLATRYHLPMWDIYMAHLEFLFSDSGLSTEELKEHIGLFNIIPALKEKPSEFVARLYTHVYPTISGIDHARMLFFFKLFEGLDEEKKLWNISAAGHVKILKKLHSLAPDLDYVKLMDDSTSPVDLLAPYLTSTNINNIIKLAATIPDKKGGFMHPSSLYCGWAVRIFWKGEKAVKSQPQNAGAWLNRYESCRDYIQRLLPSDFITFVCAISCSKESSLKLEIQCRQDIVHRAIKFCHQQIGRRKKETNSVAIEDWASAESQLLTIQSHLKSMESDTIKSFLQAEDPRFHQYALRYDISCGDPNKVRLLLQTMVIDGQPLEMVDDFLQVAPPVGVTVRDILEQALLHIINTLRGNEGDVECKIYDPLARLECIFHNIQAHIENEGELVGRKQAVDVLHPYISDAKVPIQQRTAVLEVMEKTVGLGQEHATILLWCRTLNLVHPVWSNIQLKEADIETEVGRLQLFEELLANVTLASHFHTLCKLLELWPPFNRVTSKGELPWTQALLAMANSSNPATVAVIDNVFREMDPDDFPLNQGDTKTICDALLINQHPLEGVKVILRSNHKKLFASAVLILSAEDEIYEDNDLVDLVLKHCLTPQLTTSPIYPFVTKAILRAHGDPATPPHLQLETVVQQLEDAGFHTEARALSRQAHTTRPLLQSVGSALGAMGSWFKS